MPVAQIEPQVTGKREWILTLAEAAAFLRTNEPTLAKMAKSGEVPGKKIGKEWRFLMPALLEWLGLQSPLPESVLQSSSNGSVGHLSLEELLQLLEKRLLLRIAENQQPSPKPGSKEAVDRHVGIFKDDDDLEEVLASLAAIRAGWNAEAKQ